MARSLRRHRTAILATTTVCVCAGLWAYRCVPVPMEEQASLPRKSVGPRVFPAVRRSPTLSSGVPHTRGPEAPPKGDAAPHPSTLHHRLHRSTEQCGMPCFPDSALTQPLTGSWLGSGAFIYGDAERTSLVAVQERGQETFYHQDGFPIQASWDCSVKQCTYRDPQYQSVTVWLKNKPEDSWYNLYLCGADIGSVGNHEDRANVLVPTWRQRCFLGAMAGDLDGSPVSGIWLEPGPVSSTLVVDASVPGPQRDPVDLSEDWDRHRDLLAWLVEQAHGTSAESSVRELQSRAEADVHEIEAMLDELMDEDARCDLCP